MSLKNSARTPIGSVIEKETYYGSITNHQYLIRYVIKVDIQRRFENVQGIQRYRLTWFLACVGEISNEKRL